MVPLGRREPKEAFLQDRIPAIPERQRKAQTAFAVGDPQETIFPPAIGTAAGVIVREVVPARPVLGVVLADCAPTGVLPSRVPSVSSCAPAWHLRADDALQRQTLMAQAWAQSPSQANLGK